MSSSNCFAVAISFDRFASECAMIVERECLTTERGTLVNVAGGRWHLKFRRLNVVFRLCLALDVVIQKVLRKSDKTTACGVQNRCLSGICCFEMERDHKIDAEPEI